VPGEGSSFQGVKAIAPWWDLQGRWPEAAEEAIIGATLAKRLGVSAGSEMEVRSQGEVRRFRISGVVTTGGYEEEQLFAPLVTVQELW
jgi:putative ABC transport system permease protein